MPLKNSNIETFDDQTLDDTGAGAHDEYRHEG